jgi:hypothetical protein
MNAVSVPLYQASSAVSLADILNDLRRLGRSGIVIEEGDEYRLVFAGELLSARAQGAKSLQDFLAIAQPRGAAAIAQPRGAYTSTALAVSGGVEYETMLLLGDSHAQRFRIDLVRPLRSWQEYETLFLTESSSFALAGATLDSALVVTAHEGGGEALTLTGGYQCDGTPTHYFPRPRVSAGQTCPKFHPQPRPDGTPPQVHPAP